MISFLITTTIVDAIVSLAKDQNLLIIVSKYYTPKTERLPLVLVQIIFDVKLLLLLLRYKAIFFQSFKHSENLYFHHHQHLLQINIKGLFLV